MIGQVANLCGTPRLGDLRVLISTPSAPRRREPQNSVPQNSELQNSELQNSEPQRSGNSDHAMPSSGVASSAGLTANSHPSDSMSTASAQRLWFPHSGRLHSGHRESSADGY